jgi:hypothetical protein
VFLKHAFRTNSRQVRSLDPQQRPPVMPDVIHLLTTQRRPAGQHVLEQEEHGRPREPDGFLVELERDLAGVPSGQRRIAY